MPPKRSGALLVLIAAASLSPHLSRSVQYDEAYTFTIYAQHPLTALFQYNAPNNHLLHSFLVWLSTSLMGDSLLAIRFPAFVFGLLCLALIYRLAYRLAYPLDGQWAASLALIFLLLAPFFAEFATNARGYTLAAFFGLALFETLYFSPPQPSAWRGRRVMLFCWLLIISLPTMLLLIGLLMLWIAWTRRGAVQPTLRYWIPAGFGLLYGAFFYTYGLVEGHIGSSAAIFGYENNRQLWSEWLETVFNGVTAPFLALSLLAGVFWLATRSRRLGGLLLLIFGGALLFSLAQELLSGRVLYPRNYFYLLPFVALIAGWGAAGLLSRTNRLASLFFVVVLLLIGVEDLQTLSEPTQIDALYDAIQSHAAEDDLLMVGCCWEYQLYYLLRDTPYTPFEGHKSRLVVIPTTLESVEVVTSTLGDLVHSGCYRDEWNDFEVLICPPLE